MNSVLFVTLFPPFFDELSAKSKAAQSFSFLSIRPPNQGHYPGGDHITPVTSHAVPTRVRAPDVITARNGAHPATMTRSKSLTLMTHGKSHDLPIGDVTKEHPIPSDVRNSCRSLGFLSSETVCRQLKSCSLGCL